MLGFKADAKAAVDAAWSAGVANGGTDDGPPGNRPPDKDGWYGAYLRDPTGNKLCVFYSG